MRMGISLGTVLGVVAALLVVAGVRAQTANRFFPDLTFDYNCAPSAPTPDLLVEEFLAGQGFRVMNRARAFERFGRTPLQPFEIIALDKRSRIIRFGARSVPQGRYHVILYTRPPTHRSSELEDRLLEFVGRVLGCEVVRMTRHRNEADAQSFFDRVFSNYEAWFKQLDEMERRPL